MSQRLSINIEGACARVRLNHPPVNVIDLATMAELLAALEDAGSRKEITSIIFCGGKDFSGGVDIAAHTPDKIKEMLCGFHAVIKRLSRTPKLTIAAVRGRCLGGGAELAMMCDLVYTAADATWQFPEIKLGCYPPVACAALAAIVGRKRAAEMILTGKSFTGSEAQRWGLANEALPDDQVEAAADAAVAHASGLSSMAVSLAKKAFYSSQLFDEELERVEKIYLEELMRSEDAREGIEAWLEKRKPVWSGR